MIRQAIWLCLAMLALLCAPAAKADVAAVCDKHKKAWQSAKATGNASKIAAARSAIPGGSCPTLKKEANGYKAPVKPVRKKEPVSDTPKPKPRTKPKLLPIEVKVPDISSNAAQETPQQLFERGKAFEVAANYKAALPLFVKSCEEYYAPACGYAGDYYNRADRVGTKNPSVSLQLFQWGCDDGSAFSCNWAGALQRDYFNRADLAKPLFEKACSSKAAEPILPDQRANACNNLGLNLEVGQGGAADDALARIHYKRSCDLSMPDGCYNMGRVLYYKIGGAEDKPGGKLYWEDACKAQYLLACKSLETDLVGRINSSNILGGNQYADAATVRTNLDKFCNDTVAYTDKGLICYELGKAEQVGMGGARNEAKSQLSYQRACTYKSAVGCFSLGIAWSIATNIAGYDQQAKTYYALACTYGMKAACEPPYR